MESDLASAVAAQADVKREVDTFRIGRVAEGQASLSGSRQRARELSGELDALFTDKGVTFDKDAAEKIRSANA